MNLRDGLIICTILTLLGGIYFLNSPRTSMPRTQHENTPLTQKNEVRAEVGYVAPDLNLVTLDGKDVSLFKYRGKPTVITFWTTWCGFCRSEMPYIQKAYRKYGEQVNFLMVNITVQDKEDKVASYINGNKYSFPVLLDKDGKGSRDYGVRGLPVTFILSPGGKIQSKTVGAMEAEELGAAIEKALSVK